MGLQLPEPFGTEPLTTNRVVVKDSTAELKAYPNLYETGSEPLEVEELRVAALGTGYPARRGQADPEQIVTRMVKPEPAPLLVVDQEYQARMDPQPDPGVMHGLPDWLEETVIPIDFIEEFKRELAEGHDH